MDPRCGLSWEQAEGDFGELEELRPTWTVEPDVEVIAKIVRRKLNIPADSPCAVEFLAEGTFNKVYTIQCNSDTEYIIRVPLPVHPRLKTMSECATIEYVRHHTDILAPQVLHYNALCDDELGFEYMIQERVPGSKLKDQWQYMSWLEKELLVRKVIEYLAQLFRQRFRRLGNVYATCDLQRLSDCDLPDTTLLSAEHSTGTTGFSISEIVSIPFFYNDHRSLNIERGPYKHSRDWLTAQLQLALHDADNIPEEQDDEVEEEDIDNQVCPGLFAPEPTNRKDSSPLEDEWYDTDSSITSTDTSALSDSESESSDNSNSESDNDDPNSPAAIKHRIQRLQALLPKIFPATISETYILHHQDLSSNNILLHSSHTLAGIIDWECVHTVPLYLACQIPKFLRGPSRSSPPPFEQDFEDEWYEKAYYEGIEEHEKTRLRDFFVMEMRRVCPEWVDVFEQSAVKADFEFAVSVVGVKGHGEPLDEWIEAVEEGEEAYDLRGEMGQC